MYAWLHTIPISYLLGRREDRDISQETHHLLRHMLWEHTHTPFYLVENYSVDLLQYCNQRQLVHCLHDYYSLALLRSSHLWLHRRCMIQPCFVAVVSSSFLVLRASLNQHFLCKIIYTHPLDRCEMLCLLQSFQLPRTFVGLLHSCSLHECQTICFGYLWNYHISPSISMISSYTGFFNIIVFVKQCSNFFRDSSNCHDVYVANSQMSK